MKLTFEPKNFETLRKTFAALEKQLYTDGYFGTDAFVLKFDYCNEFKQLLRPFPNLSNLEFELGLVKCQDCATQNLMLFCGKTTWVCDKCLKERAKAEVELTNKSK